MDTILILRFLAEYLFSSQNLCLLKNCTWQTTPITFRHANTVRVFLDWRNRILQLTRIFPEINVGEAFDFLFCSFIYMYIYLLFELSLILLLIRLSMLSNQLSQVWHLLCKAVEEIHEGIHTYTLHYLHWHCDEFLHQGHWLFTNMDTTGSWIGSP